MADTKGNLIAWLKTLPPRVEVGIDAGGLTLYPVEDDTIPHGPDCHTRRRPPAPCADCWKAAYYELGGLPEGDDR